MGNGCSARILWTHSEDPGLRCTWADRNRNPIARGRASYAMSIMKTGWIMQFHLMKYGFIMIYMDWARFFKHNYPNCCSWMFLNFPRFLDNTPPNQFQVGVCLGLVLTAVLLYLLQKPVDNWIGSKYQGWQSYAGITLGVPIALCPGVWYSEQSWNDLI